MIDDGWIGDDGNNVHFAPALYEDKRIDLVHPPDQAGPVRRRTAVVLLRDQRTSTEVPSIFYRGSAAAYAEDRRRAGVGASVALTS